MSNYKKDIITNICYTQLVYGRINKKLNISLSNTEIEAFIMHILTETGELFYIKKGKNIYVSNQEKKVRLTVNSYTYRIITADIIKP